VLAIRQYGSTNGPLASVAVPMLEPGRLAQLALDLPAGTQPAGEQIYTLTADETHVTGDVNRGCYESILKWLSTCRFGVEWCHTMKVLCCEIPGYRQKAGNSRCSIQ
jgi:hypothetical protein